MTNVNCRTCFKYCEISQGVSIQMNLSQNKTISDLIAEWASVEVTQDERLPQVICEMCFTSVKEFVSFINLIRRSDGQLKEALNSKEVEPLVDPLPPVSDDKKSYSCKDCGKLFSKSYSLTYHMRIHTGEKAFKCNFCHKSFVHPSNLYKHKKIHTNTRSYTCEFCRKSFIQSEALQIHIRRIHTGEKPFLCEMCSKTFPCHSALWLHKQDVHLQKKPCPQCHKQFSSRTLKQHIKLHKNKEQNIKKFICVNCGAHFSSGHNLRKHMLTHDGVRPYASEPQLCIVCNKSYSKRRIKSHICIAVT